MTDESDVSPAADEAVSARSAQTEEQTPENVQSLTDFFDQMDRAAFKRALANRDAQRAEIGAAQRQVKSRRT